VSELGQCVASVWGGHYARQCERKAKFRATVKNHWMDKDHEPYDIPLCGVHNRMAEKGRHFSIVTGEPRTPGAWSTGVPTKSVTGIQTDLNKAMGEAEVAARSAQRAYESTRFQARKVGEAVIDDPNSMELLNQSGDERVKDAIKWYEESVRVYQERKAESARMKAVVSAMTEGEPHED
jgi:hypothetical protein